MLTATSDEERARLAGLTAAMSATDSVLALSADLPGTSRVMAGLTSAGFAAASGYVALNG